MQIPLISESTARAKFSACAEMHMRKKSLIILLLCMIGENLIFVPVQSGRMEIFMTDTIELLKECDAGAKMALSAIDDVLEHVDSSTLSEILKNSREKHINVGESIHESLNKYGQEDKEPPAVAKGMSKLKTSFKLTTNESDCTVADIVTDGCNMGIKTLHRYINEYSGANELSRSLAFDLINIEEDLRKEVSVYL